MSPLRPSLAAIVLSAAVLSGCGTGLQAQTYKETGRGDGAAVNLDTLAIRDLHVEPPSSDNTIPAGGAAVLTGALVNHGGTADSLTSVTTDAAGSVSFTQDGRPATTIAIPAGGADMTWSADLEGLTAALRSGTYITVTLTFARAGTTTLHVPVQNGDAGLESRSVNQNPNGEGG